MADLETGYLADFPESIPILARWHHAEWGPLVRDWSLSLAEAELRSHTARRAIPTTIIARLDGTLAGSASLLAEDMPDFPPYTPWLGSVFVPERFRSRGIGNRLVARILEEAAALSVPTIYLFTTEAEVYYRARGWRVLEPRISEGQQGVIMHLHLRK